VAKSLFAHEHPLKKIFSSDYSFRIPQYQRPYRWGVDQAVQLLDDLEESLDRNADEPYFLGSLVLVEVDGATYDVIDGQQRLTTLTILFAVLRDLSESDLADRLAALVMQPGDVLEGLKPEPRLATRLQDRAFFTKYVQTPGGIPALAGLSEHAVTSEPQRAMRDNAVALWNRLRGWEPEKRLRLGTFAVTNTFLVTVSTPDLESAYRIFSVMNARGLDLAPADIFKSAVVGKFADNSPIAKQWEDAEEALGSDDFSNLFRDIRTIFSGERARRELLKEFPEQVLDQYLSSGRAEEFVSDVLVPYSEAFLATSNHELGHGLAWRTANAHLRRLQMIDNQDWRPTALWAIKNHATEPEFLGAFLSRLERLAASLLLRGEYTTPRIARYLELLNQVRDGAGLDAAAFVLEPSEKASARTALDGEVYRMQTRRSRYVLLRLDEVLAKDPGATYSHDIISIEHVLPQNPAADSEWAQNFSLEEREYWTHRLGNLLLLNRRKNSQASNYDFTAKKAKYFAGASGSAVFALTTQVLSELDWNVEVVSRRQHELVNVLITEWDLSGDVAS
jgi:hypothetical protein